MTSTTHRSFLQTTLLGGMAAAILGVLDAMVAFKLILNLTPVEIYKLVAYGLLGGKAYASWLSVAGLGFVLHFLVALTAAALYNLAALGIPFMKTRYIVCGLGFGVLVYAFMNAVVIPLYLVCRPTFGALQSFMNNLVLPLSAIPTSMFYRALFLNGVIGHALFVGLPISYFAGRGK